MIAVSVDDAATLRKFRDSLAAPMHFVSDKADVLVKAYDSKGAITGWAKRTTFVIGEGRKVLEVQEGLEALEPAGAIRACSLHKDAAVEKALEPAVKPTWAPDSGR